MPELDKFLQRHRVLHGFDLFRKSWCITLTSESIAVRRTVTRTPKTSCSLVALRRTHSAAKRSQTCACADWKTDREALMQSCRVYIRNAKVWSRRRSSRWYKWGEDPTVYRVIYPCFGSYIFLDDWPVLPTPPQNSK